MAELARRGQANGVEAHELDQAGMRAHEPHVRGHRRAVRAVHRGLRLPADRREARRAGGQGGRRDPPRPRGVPAGAAAAPTWWCAPTPGDLLGTQVVACAGLRCDELARASGADPGVRILPFRGEYSGPAAAGRRPGQRPDLPGARPGLPVPRGARHPRHRRHRARRPERGARAGPGGLRVAHRAARASWPGRWPTRACCGWPASTGGTGWGRCTARCPGPRWPPRSSACCPTCGPSTWSRPGPGCAPRRCARTARWSTTSCSSSRAPGGPGSVLHVLNAPSPAATAALPIGREIVARLTGQRLGPSADDGVRAGRGGLPVGVRVLRRAAQRGQVDADQRADRVQDRDHVQPAADHPARDPRHPAPAGRAADRGRHPRPAQAAHAARAAGSTTWSGRPGPRST